MSLEDSITLEAAPPRPGSSLAPARLLELLLTPRTYFANRGFLQDQRAVMIAAYVAGVSGAIDRIDQKMVRLDLRGQTGSADAFISWIAESWLHYWTLALGAGLISAAFIWHLGGWWFKKRVHWSGAADATPHDARRVNILQQLVFTGPAVALGVAQTVLYQNYGEAWNSDSLTGMLVVAMLLWSCWTAYCGVTTVFPVKKSKARIWFLILPVIFYLMVLGVFTALYAMLAR
jgi:hypothetical protein